VNFDWTMVKGMQTSRDSSRSPAPMPTEKPRFLIPDNSYPVKLDKPIPLLDFINWCAPDDGSSELGAIARLYDSLDGDTQRTPPAPSAR
jgi:hypothetical protein